MTCEVVGVSGASGSGKTQLCRTILQELSCEYGADSVLHICEDWYYRDQSAVPMEERVHANYDHPNSLDHELLVEHLKQLRRGQVVQVPQYDYTKHTRAAQTLTMAPKKVIVVEGILLFTNPEIRAQINFLVFVDTPLDVCLIRRTRRDMEERGRTYDSVIQQYEATVRPMYLQFIEPSRQWADIMVPSWKDNRVAIDMIKAKLSQKLSKI